MSTTRPVRLVSRTAAMALMALAIFGAEAKLLTAAPHGHDTIVVTTTAELEAALVPANAGRRILVRAGEYALGQALTVPDDATLVGEGDMDFDESGLPTGFDPSGRTLLKSTTALVGDVLTLGDGSTIRGLVIEDAAGRLTGNPVVVSSRAPGDSVSATIVECEIINPNPSGIVPQGPTGRGLVVITRNPNLGQAPPPHEGAVLWVQLKRSIIHSPASGFGIFAINFASHSEIQLVLKHNVVGGGLNANGGVSRPDAVTGASVTVQSTRNLYRSDSAAPTAIGWTLSGGSTAPIPGFVSEASTSNSLQMQSNDDAIEGFATGVSAVGGLRSTATGGLISLNSLDLNFHGLQLATTTADLQLFGARSLVDGVSPGDGNTLRMLLRQATGSGPRANLYADSASPSMTNLGAGNELEVTGNERAFVRSNDDVDPIPPSEFFTEKR